MIRGRPVRFLAMVLGGWTALRATMLFSILPHMAGSPETQPASPHPGSVRRTPSSSHRIAFADQPGLIPMARSGKPIRLTTAGVTPLWPSAMEDSTTEAQPGLVRTPHQGFALADFAPGAGIAPAEAALPLMNRPGRWSGSVWMLWRNDDPSPGYALGPRLGGSQAGVRIDYALAPESVLRPTLYGRLSSALRDPAAAEAAVGIAIRPPLPFPFMLAAERRKAVSDGGRNAFALLAAGGLNPVEIGHGFRLDGYAQAGMVGFRRHDGFADGRLTVEKPLSGSPRVALGVGVWGAIQPDVSRFDIGPQASLRLNLGGANLRLGAEWRERIAGNANPASGPAITLGTDF